MAKQALMGFSRLTFFPVTQDDAAGYAVGTGFLLPGAQEMTKQASTTETKIYADDGLYLDNIAWEGIKSTISLTELPLDVIEKLGFGVYDQAGGTLKFMPQGKNLAFAVTYRALRADGSYRMYKMYNFTVSEVKEAGVKSAGQTGSFAAMQITGVFTRRACDGATGEIKDGADPAWLDSVETVG